LVVGNVTTSSTGIYNVSESGAASGAALTIASGASISGSLVAGANFVNISNNNVTPTVSIVSGYNFVGTPSSIGSLSQSTSSSSSLVTFDSGGAISVSSLNVAGSVVVNNYGTMFNGPVTPGTTSSASGYNIGGNLTNNGILSIGSGSTNTSPAIQLSTGASFANYGTLQVNDANLTIAATNIILDGSVYDTASSSNTLNTFGTVTIGNTTSSGITEVDTTLSATGSMSIMGGGVSIGSSSNLSAYGINFSAGSVPVSSIAVTGASGATTNLPVSLLLNGGTYASHGTGTGGEGTISATAAGNLEVDWTAPSFNWSSDALNLTATNNVVFNSPDTYNTGVATTVTAPNVYYTGALTVQNSGSLNIEGGTSSAPVNVYVNGFVYNNDGSITFGGSTSATQKYTSSDYNFNMHGYMSNGTDTSSLSSITGPASIIVGGELTNYGTIDAYALTVDGIYNEFGTVVTDVPVVATGPIVLPFNSSNISIPVGATNTVEVNSASLPTLAAGSGIPASIIWNGSVIPSSWYGFLGI
jgi:hypothetical protein